MSVNHYKMANQALDKAADIPAGDDAELFYLLKGLTHAVLSLHVVLSPNSEEIQ